MGTVKDFGGPKKYIKSETSNSIWDSEVIDRQKEAQDSKERIQAEKQQIQKLRDDIKQERLDKMVEAIQGTDTRKASTVTRMADAGSDTYKAPQNGISIFDKGDFERIAEKTEGEKIRDRARAPKEKDESWKEIRGAQSTSKVTSALFDQIFKSEE